MTDTKKTRIKKFTLPLPEELDRKLANEAAARNRSKIKQIQTILSDYFDMPLNKESGQGEQIALSK